MIQFFAFDMILLFDRLKLFWNTLY